MSKSKVKAVHLSQDNVCTMVIETKLSPEAVQSLNAGDPDNVLRHIAYSVKEAVLEAPKESPDTLAVVDTVPYGIHRVVEKAVEEADPGTSVEALVKKCVKNVLTLKAGGTVYHKDTTVTLPEDYEGVDG